MRKTFIFDWSGTLNNNFHCFCQVVALMFQELGKKPISNKEISMQFTTPYMKFWNTYFPDLSKEKQCELYEKYIHQVEEAQIHKESKELIHFLYSLGCRIFIVSSDPLSKLILETEKSGLSDMFEKIIGDIHEKGACIASLVEEFDLNKKDTFYIGDTSGDIEAGKFAGIKTIGISWGFQDKSILSKSNPDFLIDNILEIKNI